MEKKSFAALAGGRIETFTLEDVAEMERVMGRSLFMLPLASKQLGHRNPLNSYRDYMGVALGDDQVAGAAKEFLHDLIARTQTEEMIAKWYPQAVLKLL